MDARISGVIGMINFPGTFLVVALALLTGCQAIPVGPTVTTLQGDARGPGEFRADDEDCRKYASAPEGEVRLASKGGTGSVIDGVDSAQYAGYGLQQRYNRLYVQCMYIRGNKVPVLARERWPAPRSPWPADPEAYFLPVER